MTLLTAIISRDFVALAADRRLTSRRPNGQIIWQTDADTKIAVVDGELLVGYAGSVPYETSGSGFGDWLGDFLAPLGAGDFPTLLEKELTRSWQADANLRDRPFILLLVGFPSNSFGVTEAGCAWLISNCFDSTGSFAPANRPDTVFTTVKHSAPDNGYSVVTEGFDLHGISVQDDTVDLERRANGTIDPRNLCWKFNELYGQAEELSGGDVGAASIAVVMNKSARRSSCIAVPVREDVIRFATGGSDDDFTSRGEIDYVKEIVATYLHSAYEGPMWTPASIGTGRWGGFHGRLGSGRIRLGQDAIEPRPMPGAITPESPGV